ncbi:GMC oxidoreductase [Rubritalea tangerina]|uniref:Cholesterol oxidase n=1 Tax=Rubritalea tangerina TaxID=430798 RepID=A0ABW4ZEU3_9BACT
MNRISTPVELIEESYDVVVVGSGYGGGIAASRLSRAGKKVCLLERGKEWIPGEFPNTDVKAAENMQLDLPEKKVGSSVGLYNFHLHKDVQVLVGCGLGGTSLINANVSLHADPRVFTPELWPKGLLDDRDTRLADGFKRAEEMLKPNPYPENFPPLKKLEAAKVAAEATQQPFSLPPINVTFQDGVNHVGVEQKACNNCGDCVSGCNNLAKNTTQMNYLPDAWNHGAKIFTECSVKYLEKTEGSWLVHFQPLQSGRGRFDAPTQFVKAETVILSAGTLGSTEIMLRTKAHGLDCSPMVGKRFSGNGDVLGFSYNGKDRVNGVGYGTHKVDPKNPCGPCITTLTDTRKTAENYLDGMVVEEGSIPGALAPGLPSIFSALAKTIGEDENESFPNELKEEARKLDSLLRGAHHGAMAHTQTYLVMSHDDGDGQMTLDNDRMVLNWPGYGREDVFKRVNDFLKRCALALDGTFIKNPIWTKLFDKALISVHPLGGCIMGEDASKGVVNDRGQVFAGASGTDLHEGLYITDGSVIPTSLGVNPLFTISAISERNMRYLCEAQGWPLSYQLPSAPTQQSYVPKLGIEFTETMKGFWNPGSTEFQEGYNIGKEGDTRIEFTLQIDSDDLDTLIDTPAHPARISGTLTAPALSPEPLTVTDGVFQLFNEVKNEVETRHMTYSMCATSETGHTYFFHGYKEIRADGFLDIWHDTSTLYSSIYEGENANGNLLGRGILHIAPKDFMVQMTTMKVTHADSLEQRLEALTRFGKFFAGTLWDIYGGVAAPLEYFNPDAPPRQKRPLRAPAPEVYPFQTADGKTLRLTRYNAGNKNTVMCSHGLGVASSIFSTDLIDTNLLEYLCAHEYDVWLLDFRCSIELPQLAAEESTGDDVAKYDYPAAVAKVRELTEKESIQVVVHCYGAATWTMSMLNGLEGVNSAVISQVSAHMKAPFMTNLKTGLHTAEVLNLLGVDTLTAYTSSDANWKNKLIDQALKLYPVGSSQHCHNPVCHRITFLYSLLYEHQQLNETLHENLHELFGVGNIEQFEHLSTMVRKGYVTAFNGDDIYLPHPERMAIPITFISGAKNQCYLPESTELTFEYLRNANDPDLYERHVIPEYGHIDCIFGKNAVHDVYPTILAGLERGAKLANRSLTATT